MPHVSSAAALLPPMRVIHMRRFPVRALAVVLEAP